MCSRLCSWLGARCRDCHDGAPAAPPDTRERFFGAVQSIYNPDRAAQAGVAWERLIFPWSLIQKTGTDGLE